MNTPTGREIVIWTGKNLRALVRFMEPSSNMNVPQFEYYEDMVSRYGLYIVVCNDSCKLEISDGVTRGILGSVIVLKSDMLNVLMSGS